MKLFITFLIPMFISFNVYSLPASIAKVIKMRGEATVLSAGAKAATKVFLGMRLKSDSSILTKSKSIVIVQYDDKSRVVVGPSSKVIILKEKRSKIGMVNLLKGKIRTAVPHRNNEKIKFNVVTRSAAMGVRGTEFITSFNPKNGNSSLLTLKGAVLVKGRDEIRSDKENIVPSKKLDEIQAGRFAGVTGSGKKGVDVVRVSPRQVALLSLNKEMSDNIKVDNLELTKEIKKIEKIYSNTKKENSNIASGGLVDIDTGFYIPPVKKNYDKRLQIYKVDDDLIGKANKSGNYVPPKGVILDSIKGVVVDENVASSKVSVAFKEVKVSVKTQIDLSKKAHKPLLDNLKSEESIEKLYYR